MTVFPGLIVAGKLQFSKTDSSYKMTVLENW